MGASQTPPLSSFIFSLGPVAPPPPPPKFGSLGSPLPPAGEGRRPIFTAQVKAESLIVCTGEAPFSLLPYLPVPLGWVADVFILLEEMGRGGGQQSGN